MEYDNARLAQEKTAYEMMAGRRIRAHDDAVKTEEYIPVHQSSIFLLETQHRLMDRLFVLARHVMGGSPSQGVDSPNHVDAGCVSYNLRTCGRMTERHIEMVNEMIEVLRG